VKHSRPLPGLEPPIVQPVAQRYTTELPENHKPMSEIKQWPTYEGYFRTFPNAVSVHTTDTMNQLKPCYNVLESDPTQRNEQGRCLQPLVEADE
jgi:hypothetical protein